MGVELVLLPRVAHRGRVVSGARLTGLLALLAGDVRRGCSTAGLVDGLWPDRRPDNPTKAVQILVSRLRAQLGAELIERTPTGYRLGLDPEQVDAAALRLLAADVEDPAGSLAAAEAGLALWDGTVVEEPTDPLTALRAESALVARRLERARALALARLGRYVEAVGPLADFADRDDEVLLELLRAEGATAGPSAALARYEAYRRRLRDELGTDPAPALRAAYQELLRADGPVVRNGVQQEPNPLVGRDGDVAAVLALLRSARVVSVVGPGGLGKTRLANAVAARAQQRVVHVVPLAAVDRDEDVLAAVAAALGLGEPGPAGPRQRVAAALAVTPALLVLDNCEHVLAGAADLVAALVATLPDLRVLTTSRAPLGLSAESVYLLPELDLATAAELFGQRARAARSTVDLPADAVRAVCRQLDGMPLAVELAAARVRVMSVAEIGRRLADRFELLRGGPRDAPERHRTMHAVVGWSWNLLDDAGRSAMRALSVFPGGFTADAARQVGAGDALEHLVDQSLLRVTDTPAGARFRMLEAVREFAAADRDPDAEDRFRAWARDFGRTWFAAPFGPDPGPGMDQLAAEQDNLAHALRLAVDRGDGDTVAATAAGLAGLWMVGSNYARLVSLGDDAGWALSHHRPAGPYVEPTRAVLSVLAGYALSVDPPRAARSLVALQRLPVAAPDTLAAAMTTALTAGPAELPGLARSPAPLLAAAAGIMLSYRRESAGDPAGAAAAAERTLAALAGVRVPLLHLLAHARLGELHVNAGHGAEALRHLRAAMQVPGAPPAWPDLMGVRPAAVLASLQAGALDEAARWLERGPGPVDESFAGRSSELAVRAELALARGDAGTGLTLWRRAVDIMRGSVLPGLRVEPGLEPWALEITAVAVVAHARHHRLAPVEEDVARLERALASLLSGPVLDQPFPLAGLPLCGALVLALGMVALERGDGPAGARMVALAERLSFARQFQPTMSAAAARSAAEDADGPAYAAAVAEYAGLDAGALRAAARQLAGSRSYDRSAQR